MLCPSMVVITRMNGPWPRAGFKAQFSDSLMPAGFFALQGLLIYVHQQPEANQSYLTPRCRMSNLPVHWSKPLYTTYSHLQTSQIHFWQALILSVLMWVVWGNSASYSNNIFSKFLARCGRHHWSSSNISPITSQSSRFVNWIFPNSLRSTLLFYSLWSSNCSQVNWARIVIDYTTSIHQNSRACWLSVLAPNELLALQPANPSMRVVLWNLQECLELHHLQKRSWFLQGFSYLRPWSVLKFTTREHNQGRSLPALSSPAADLSLLIVCAS